MTKVQFKNLEQLGDNYDILVFDASAIRAYLTGNGPGNKRRSIENLDFIPILEKWVSSGRNYMIPNDVINELYQCQRKKKKIYPRINKIIGISRKTKPENRYDA